MKLRKSIGFLSFLMLPITLNYFSPVLIVQGSLERTFTAMHIVFGLMALCAVFFGGSWCGYICPFGALQELLPNRKLKQGNQNNKLRKLKLLIGSIFLVLIIMPIAIYGFQNIIIPYHMEDTKISISNIHDLIRYYIIVVSIILITIMLGKRGWCRYVCPMYIFNYIGIKLGKLLRLPHFGMAGYNKKCTQCKQCNNNCLMGLDVANMVKNNKWDRYECIQCGECSNACKCDALKRKWQK